MTSACFSCDSVVTWTDDEVEFTNRTNHSFSFTTTDTPNTSADRGAHAVWVPQYKKRNACVKGWKQSAGRTCSQVRVSPKLASHQRLLTRTTHSIPFVQWTYKIRAWSLLKLNASLRWATRRALLCKTCLIESHYFETFSLEVHEICEEWYFNYVLAAHINKSVRFSLLRRRSLSLVLIYRRWSPIYEN